MAHPRKLIRQAVAAQLAGQTAAGARVFRSRMVPLKRVELPAIAIYTPEEEADFETDSAPRELKRTLQLYIESAADGTGDVDDVLDDLAEQIEAAMDADDTLDGNASSSVLTRTELDVDESTGRTVSVIRLTYAVTYYAFAPAEVAAPDDFITADIRHSVNGDQAAADQARDVVAVQE